MVSVSAIGPAEETAVMDPVVGGVLAGWRGCVRVIRDERAHPVSGAGASAVEGTVADLDVVAGVEAHPSFVAIEFDSIHCDMGFLFHVNTIGGILNDYFFLFVALEYDPLVWGSGGGGVEFLVYI